jgi:hypothetical protein
MGEYKLLICQEAANQDLFKEEAKGVYRLCESLSTNERIDALLADADFFGPTVQLGCVEVFPTKDQETYFQAQVARIYPGMIVDLLTPVEGWRSYSRVEHEYFNVPLFQLVNYKRAIYPTDRKDCVNLLLIDATVAQAQVLFNAVNATSFPVLFTRQTLRSEILALRRQYVIETPRLAILADNSFMWDSGTKPFLNGEPYFTSKDLSATDEMYSPNITFLRNFARVDFLACESLTYASWVRYYAILTGQGLPVGASNDTTGNLAAGGDWIMESTGQDVQTMYFTSAITAYQSTLIALDPVNVTSSFNLDLLAVGNTVVFTNTVVPLAQITITLTGTYIAGSGQISIAGDNITVDGSGCAVNAPSLFLPGDVTGLIIQNITANLSVPTLEQRKGGLCDRQTGTFDLEITFLNCTVNFSGAVEILHQAGGICAGMGHNVSLNTNTSTFTNCSTNVNGDMTIGNGDSAGGICGGNWCYTSHQTFTGCSTNAVGSIIINQGEPASGGIYGGDNCDNSSTSTFTGCSTNADGDLTIRAFFGAGGIIGNSFITTSFFSDCGVNTKGILTVQPGAGSITGGGALTQNITLETICSTSYVTSIGDVTTAGPDTINGSTNYKNNSTAPPRITGIAVGNGSTVVSFDQPVIVSGISSQSGNLDTAPTFTTTGTVNGLTIEMPSASASSVTFTGTPTFTSTAAGTCILCDLVGTTASCFIIDDGVNAAVLIGHVTSTSTVDSTTSSSTPSAATTLAIVVGSVAAAVVVALGFAPFEGVPPPPPTTTPSKVTKHKRSLQLKARHNSLKFIY